MRKLSKQVLALGLASGVLLSGLPIGNVVDAASKPAVTKVAKAELTTKQKIAVELEKLRAYKSLHAVELSKFETSSDALRDRLMYMKRDYEYSKLEDAYDIPMKDISKMRSRGSDVKYKYFELFNYNTSGTEAERLADLIKRNKAVEDLNAKKIYASLLTENNRISKVVDGLKKESEAAALASRVSFEKMNTLGYQLLKRNQAWGNSINVGVVTSKFRSDLIAAGKRPYDVEKLSRDLDLKLAVEISSKLRGIKNTYENYLESFNYDPRIKENVARTVKDLDRLNKDYKDSQNALSGMVGRAYKSAGLPYVKGTFDLK